MMLRNETNCEPILWDILLTVKQKSIEFFYTIFNTIRKLYDNLTQNKLVAHSVDNFVEKVYTIHDIGV